MVGALYDMWADLLLPVDTNTGEDQAFCYLKKEGIKKTMTEFDPGEW